METLHETGAGQFRVRLVAQPASVPTSRRFVEEALTSWACRGVLDDVGLCVSELSTNATLHSGSGYFDLELHRLDGALRLVVVDGGGTPARTIAARADSYLDDVVLGDPDLDAEGMTGRGLFIVSALASSWGIDDTDLGTRVWAEFRLDGESAAAMTPTEPLVRGTDLPAAPEPTGDLSVVHLRQCPPGLLLAHDENLADIVRELQLMADRVTPEGRRVLDDIAGVVRRSAVHWDAARLEVRQAVQAGEEHIDIAVLASRDAREEVARLRRAVTAADQMSADGLLITLPVAEPVQRLRDWLEEAFVGQTGEGREPVSFPDWLAARG